PGVVFGLVFWLVVGLVAGLVVGLGVGLLVGLGAGLLFGLVGGLVGEKPDLTTTIGPVALLTQDRRTLLVLGLVCGLVCALVVGLLLGVRTGLLVGLVGGLGVGLEAGLVQTAWGGWVIAKAYLALRRQVPWNLMTFLQDAHEYRGVLRQVGAVYEFRHLDLQRHLVQQPWPPTT
ncbi:NACHT domain-containing protein, partial [Streptomyces sp. NPDC059468]